MSQFEDLGNGIVRDHKTGLEWQAGFCEDMSHEEAEDYAEGLDLGGYTDWRLPTVEELETLLDRSRHLPASSFPEMPSERFWSSSVNASSTSYAWIVSFSLGYVDSYGKDNTSHVRCVRRGPLKLQRFDASERIDELEAEIEQQMLRTAAAEVRADKMEDEAKGLRNVRDVMRRLSRKLEAKIK